MAFVETPEDEPDYFRRLRTHGLKPSESLVEFRLADNPKKLRDKVIYLLESLREWDHMQAAADGAYWRGEISKILHAIYTDTSLLERGD